MYEQPGPGWQAPSGQAPPAAGSAFPGQPAEGMFGPEPPAAQADWRSGVPPHRPPSGLFPSGPVRPTYREPHPVRGPAVTAGLAGAAAWLLVFGLLGRDLVGYAWWTILAGVVAWLAALLLARVGDRGVAVGISVSTALGWSIAATAVATRWTMTSDWPLW